MSHFCLVRNYFINIFYIAQEDTFLLYLIYIFNKFIRFIRYNNRVIILIITWIITLFKILDLCKVKNFPSNPPNFERILLLVMGYQFYNFNIIFFG